MSDEMRPYVVRQGDYLAKLAWLHGFDVDEVWTHPSNAALSALRKDHNILAPGDVIYLPVKRREWLPIQKGQTNRFVAKVPKVDVNVVFQDRDGKPLANEPCELEGLAGTGAETMPDKTDGDGKLELKLPVSVRELVIRFPRINVAFWLRPGEMDPLDETAGIRKRLHHLGYGDERLLRQVDDAALLSEAVEEFQRASGAPDTGSLDDETKVNLAKIHSV
ncbi:MAG: peptidoglycan-binding protein [Minicystis sp.]